MTGTSPQGIVNLKRDFGGTRMLILSSCYRIDVAGCSYYMALIVSREHRDLEMVKKVFLTQVQELRAKID